MANSVDPDQMRHSAVSDLGLHCLQRPICPNRVITINTILIRVHNRAGDVRPVLSYSVHLLPYIYPNTSVHLISLL